MLYVISNTDFIGSIIFNIMYDNKEGNCRLYVSKVGYDNFVALISATRYINPAAAAEETIAKVLSTLDVCGIQSDNILDSIYLDLMEIMGMRNPHIFKWNISFIGDTLKDELIPFEEEHLPKVIRSALQDFYSMRTNVIKESPLSIRDKTELAVLPFKEFCCSKEYTNTIKRGLVESIRNISKNS